MPDGAADTQIGTRKPQEVTFDFEGQLVTLIDTPGFADLGRRDEEVLEDIARHLVEMYGDGLLLEIGRAHV